MALISCPECDRSVSDQADACPGCGHPVRANGSAGSSQEAAKGSGTADWVKATGIVGAAWALPRIAKILFALIVAVVFFYFLFR